METHEQSIIRECRRGNLDEFGRLYDLYIERIFRFIYNRTHHKETAEDLTAEVFMRALEHVSSFDERKGSFSSWLYRIARNAVIDHYRTHKPNVSIDDVWGMANAIDLEREADAKERLREVEKRLKSLSSDQREIVLMRVWDGLTHQEIAQITGKSEGSCKVAYSRAMKTIRELGPSALFLLLLIK